ncbi:MAG: metal-sensitive transcriptional regulator [Chloroflexi bacterium]|nr:metal-sensitive transcriptional regulator [Chloroflexota bacterium]
MPLEPDKKLQDRLARVEGQVRGLRKMLEEQRTCEDVLNQLLAARSGLEQAGLILLDRHLTDCILNDATIQPEALQQVRDTMRMWARHATHE